jgi:hypothetical protein
MIYALIIIGAVPLLILVWSLFRISALSDNETGKPLDK